MLPITQIDDLKKIEKRRKRESLYRRLGWLNFKVVIATWSVAQMVFPPAPILAAIGSMHIVWTVATLLGSLVSIVGLLLTFHYQYRKLATVLELCGLIFMAFGTFVYFATQLTLLTQGPLEETLNTRLALAIFAWGMFAAVIARMLAVIPRFHKE